MTYTLSRLSRLRGAGARTSQFALAASLGLTLATAAAAQSVTVVSDSGPLLILAEAPAAERAQLLAGLGEIRSDLQQAMLTESSEVAAVNYQHALAEVWPGLKEAMLAAGVADLEPVLQKLAAGGDKDALHHAMIEAEGALQKARSVLAPSDAEVVAAVTVLAGQAAGEIADSGPTDATAYEAAWANLMVARGELDMLSHSSDPAMVKLAMAEAMAIDDMFISLPHPGETGAVTVDPTPIRDLIGRLQKAGGAA
jgi:hypothetical protein